MYRAKTSYCVLQKVSISVHHDLCTLKDDFNVFFYTLGQNVTHCANMIVCDRIRTDVQLGCIEKAAALYTHTCIKKLNRVCHFKLMCIQYV